MLWELEPRVLDKCAMRLQAYRLRPTGLQRACQQALRAKQLLTGDILICDARNNLELSARQVQASLGKSRQVGRDGKSWNAGYWQLGVGTLRYPRYAGGDGKS